MTENLDFLAEIQQDFLEESGELLENSEHCYLELEKSSSDPSLLNEILRCVHTIKGGSGSVGFNDLSTFLHTLENLLIKIKNKDIAIDSSIINTLLQGNDKIKEYLNALGRDIGATVETVTLSEKINQLIGTEKKENEEPIEFPVMPQKIGEILVQKGAIKKETLDEALTIQEEQKVSLDKKEDNFIRLPLTKIDNMLDCFGEQVILQSALEFARLDLTRNSDLINKTILQLNKITYDLQQTAISLRMLSLNNFFNRCQRIVRDVSQKVGKPVTFQTSGEDTELDKSIIDQLIGPLSHILRNSIDHGIEEVEERKKMGKSENAVVMMKATQQGGFFCLEISDDGKGLDRKRILQKAVEKGLIEKEEDIEEKEIDNLILMSGFSTKDTATDISGRGVGMDVVRSTIDSLGGTLSLNSIQNKGLTVQIRLPLTLALFNGMIVRLGNRKYILPNSDVKEICHVDLKYEREINRKESVVEVKGSVIPMVNLTSLLFARHNGNGNGSGNGKNGSNGKGILVIVCNHQKEYALQVDDIVGQQKVVLKKLGKEIECLPGVAGATILGDGKVALVLEVNELIQLYNAGIKTI